MWRNKTMKLTVIGAGSLGFTRILLTDILSVKELQKNTQISFTDINEKNLDMVTQLCQRDIDFNGLDIRIEATTDRRQALKNANYVIVAVRVGGLEAFETDVDIPLKYGIDQCVGDTLCAGGIMYGQRGIAEILNFCKDIREVAAENCIMLNYANPCTMLTWAANVYGKVFTIGLCHGVQGAHKQLADILGLKKEELDYTCVGVNHQSWFISLKHNGEELTGKLLEAFEKRPDIIRTEKVRFDMLKRFGYYMTESNGHSSEYLPWYRKNLDEIKDWIAYDDWINGQTGGYLRVCIEGRNWFEYDFPNFMKEPPKVYEPASRGVEHGSYIIESLETGKIYKGDFNFMNHGNIMNLPEGCCVEGPCFVDGSGFHFPVVGDMPSGCAAVCSASVWTQKLAVEAAVKGDVSILKQAMMMDSLVGACCNPNQISQMTDEMLIAQEKWLPQYKQGIQEAKARIAQAKKDGTYIKTKEGFLGSTRVKTKTIEDMEKDVEDARRNAAAADKAKH